MFGWGNVAQNEKKRTGGGRTRAVKSVGCTLNSLWGSIIADFSQL
jgi:hypothetical protein